MKRSTWRTIIVVTGLFTALIHLVVLNIGTFVQSGRPDVLFTLNGLGFLALLVAYFWKIPTFEQRRGLIRWAFIAYAAVTILAWVILGEKARILEYLTKLSEVLLIVGLWMDGRAEEKIEAA